MSVEELTRELERLRADVKALEVSRAQSSANAEAATAAEEPAIPSDAAAASAARGEAVLAGVDTASTQDEVTGGTSGDTASAPPDPGVDPKLRSQIEELGDLLHDELKSMPAVTSLTVFTLGILLGRFLR